MTGPMDFAKDGRNEPPMDARTRAAREILRLAREDRRRGIQYWFDGELANSLRDLVREAGRQDTPPASHARPPRLIASPDARVPDIRTSLPPDPYPPATIPGPPTPESASKNPPDAADASSGTGKRPAWAPPPPATGRFEDWEVRLADLSGEAASCTLCGLCKTRRNVVFGTGSARVPLVFVGEAPGADEDTQGIPFVGRAGQLLTKIIEAIGLNREDIYICNVLKCRPPENRNPAPDEIEKCSPFLYKQLDLLRPKIICTLGLFATQTILETASPIGKLRGRLITHRGLRVFPTYHPAALLRNPSLKATVWEDVQLLRRILDEPDPD